MRYTLSQRLTHFFHVVSNIRPIIWIGIYVCITPIFAFIYWGLPDHQFRIPDGASTDYWSWLYYSIVTITTLGFGDYTPAGAGAQAVTAIEVMCGLIFLGFFLNAVGAMKSEIDVESEIEKQKALHKAMELEKLEKSRPMVMKAITTFIGYSYDATTPSTIKRLMHSASQTSLVLDSMQQRIDLSLWPELLENCFSFVANLQMFSNSEAMLRNPDNIESGEEFTSFIKENTRIASEIETLITEITDKST